MKRHFFTFIMFCIAVAAAAQVERPKLIVGLVVDQMRWDYLYYYYDQYGEGGLKRILNEGFSCENHNINYMPTVTAIGHSSTYTGSVPSLTGIAGNNFHKDGKKIYCCDDNTVKGVGSDSKAGKMSPRNMWASTIGDELKLATSFKSKVIGVALKDRASILPAGHAADAAYWYDNSVGHFITSTYYMDRLPEWVEQFNKQNNTKPGFDIKPTNEGVTMTFKMAEAALKNEKLGQRGVTDMLCVSVSSTDAVGHAFGTRGKENYEVYMQLDKDLTAFLNALDSQVGRGNYLLFLTADHGAAHNPNFLNSHKLPGGGWSTGDTKKQVNEALAAKFGVKGDYISDVIDYRLYIDRNFLDANKLDYEKVKAAAIDVLKRDSQFVYVVDFERAAESAMPEFLRERTINGYNRLRSGDIMVVTRPDVLNYTFPRDYRGTNHGAWNPYDAHIPMLFMGWHVRHGSTSEPTFITDVAATVCAMLHIQMPSACIGNAILPVVEQK